jgi:hypothetical protein
MYHMCFPSTLFSSSFPTKTFYVFLPPTVLSTPPISSSFLCSFLSHFVKNQEATLYAVFFRLCHSPHYVQIFPTAPSHRTPSFDICPSHSYKIWKNIDFIFQFLVKFYSSHVTKKSENPGKQGIRKTKCRQNLLELVFTVCVITSKLSLNLDKLKIMSSWSYLICRSCLDAFHCVWWILIIQQEAWN